MYKKIIVSSLLAVTLLVGSFGVSNKVAAAQNNLLDVAKMQVSAGASNASVISAAKNLAGRFNISIPEWGIAGLFDGRKLSQKFLQNIVSILGLKARAQTTTFITITATDQNLNPVSDNGTITTSDSITFNFGVTDANGLQSMDCDLSPAVLFQCPSTLGFGNTSLSNSITYVALAPGVYTFTVTATNSLGETTTQIFTFTVLAPAPAPACAAIPQGIVAWYKGEGNQVDTMVNFPTGTGNGTPTIVYSAGMVGQAFNFEGSNNVSILPSPSQSSQIEGQSQSEFTFDAWVSVSGSASRAQTLISRGEIAPDTAHWAVQVSSGRNVILNLGNGSDTYTATTNTTLPANTLVHVTVTFDGAQADNDKAKIYFNGVLQPSTAMYTVNVLVISTMPVVDQTMPILLGTRHDGSNGLIGILDEVELFYTAISGADIQAIVDAGSTGKCTPPPPPTVVFSVGNISPTTEVNANTPTQFIAKYSGYAGNAFDVVCDFDMLGKGSFSRGIHDGKSASLYEFTYKDEGTYNASVFCKDTASGKEASSVTKITVSAGTPPPPTEDTTPPELVNSNKGCNFDGQEKYDCGTISQTPFTVFGYARDDESGIAGKSGPAISVTIQEPNGNQSSQNVPLDESGNFSFDVNFSEEGRYTISESVRNGVGLETFRTVTIIYASKPVANYEAVRSFSFANEADGGYFTITSDSTKHSDFIDYAAGASDIATINFLCYEDYKNVILEVNPGTKVELQCGGPNNAIMTKVSGDTNSMAAKITNQYVSFGNINGFDLKDTMSLYYALDADGRADYRFKTTQGRWELKQNSPLGILLAKMSLNANERFEVTGAFLDANNLFNYRTLEIQTLAANNLYNHFGDTKHFSRQGKVIQTFNFDKAGTYRLNNFILGHNGFGAIVFGTEYDAQNINFPILSIQNSIENGRSLQTTFRQGQSVSYAASAHDHNGVETADIDRGIALARWNSSAAAHFDAYVGNLNSGRISFAAEAEVGAFKLFGLGPNETFSINDSEMFQSNGLTKTTIRPEAMHYTATIAGATNSEHFVTGQGFNLEQPSLRWITSADQRAIVGATEFNNERTYDINSRPDATGAHAIFTTFGKADESNNLFREIKMQAPALGANGKQIPEASFQLSNKNLTGDLANRWNEKISATLGAVGINEYLQINGVNERLAAFGLDAGGYRELNEALYNGRIAEMSNIKLAGLLGSYNLYNRDGSARSEKMFTTDVNGVVPENMFTAYRFGFDADDGALHERGNYAQGFGAEQRIINAVNGIQSLNFSYNKQNEADPQESYFQYNASVDGNKLAMRDFLLRQTINGNSADASFRYMEGLNPGPESAFVGGNATPIKISMTMDSVNGRTTTEASAANGSYGRVIFNSPIGLSGLYQFANGFAGLTQGARNARVLTILTNPKDDIQVTLDGETNGLLPVNIVSTAPAGISASPFFVWNNEDKIIEILGLDNNSSTISLNAKLSGEQGVARISDIQSINGLVSPAVLPSTLNRETLSAFVSGRPGVWTALDTRPGLPEPTAVSYGFDINDPKGLQLFSVNNASRISGETNNLNFETPVIKDGIYIPGQRTALVGSRDAQFNGFKVEASQPMPALAIATFKNVANPYRLEFNSNRGDNTASARLDTTDGFSRWTALSSIRKDVYNNLSQPIARFSKQFSKEFGGDAIAYGFSPDNTLGFRIVNGAPAINALSEGFQALPQSRILSVDSEMALRDKPAPTSSNLLTVSGIPINFSYRFGVEARQGNSVYLNNIVSNYLGFDVPDNVFALSPNLKLNYLNQAEVQTLAAQVQASSPRPIEGMTPIQGFSFTQGQTLQKPIQALAKFEFAAGSQIALQPENLAVFVLDESTAELKEVHLSKAETGPLAARFANAVQLYGADIVKPIEAMKIDSLDANKVDYLLRTSTLGEQLFAYVPEFPTRYTANLRVSVQEVVAGSKRMDSALETKVFNMVNGNVNGIAAQPQNYAQIYGTSAENTQAETNSPVVGNAPRNLDSDLITIGAKDGDKLVLVRSKQSADGSYGYMGFQVPGLLVGQTRDVGFNDVSGKDTFVQTSYFTQNSNGIWQSSRRAQVITGSELQVFQPDDVTWTNGTEIYPFLFISDSEWAVDVCLQVPEGYQVVAPGVCGQTFLNNEAKVLEFKVADIGSPKIFDVNASFTFTRNGKVQRSIASIKSNNPRAGLHGVKFNRDLNLGSRGEDVRALQAFLNTHGFPVTASGEGSRGNESNYFGQATKNALARFQAGNGIAATGYFGPITRNLINSQL